MGTGTASGGSEVTTTPASGSSGATSGAGGAAPEACGALEGLPSAPGPHVAQIESLGDDEWLLLGPPAADPDFGVARGRSWGGRALVLAPELRGAFFTGEGAHGYVNPDGRAMDDVWFYDIHAHAWIAIHPGNDTTTFNQRVADGELRIDGNGQLADANGDPVPLHLLIHAWDFLTYDTATHRFALLAGDGMGRYYMPGIDAIDAGLTALEGQRAGIEVPPMSPWWYSVADCRWERYPIDTPTPDVGGFAAFVYASALGKYLYVGSSGAATFDGATQAWTSLQVSGAAPSGYDHGVAYDSKRNRLYMGPGDDGSAPGLYIFDIETATWTRPASSDTGPASFRTNDASIFYDSVNDVVTVFRYADRTHHTYDPEADVWTSQPLPDELRTAFSNAFYDPTLNAYFVHVASDSTDDGVMWAYRFRGPN